jgi:uncharacterized protein YhaN
LWSQQLKLFLGVYESKLRFSNADKQLVATLEERVKAAEREAEIAQQQMEELKARLKALGVDTEQLE